MIRGSLFVQRRFFIFLLLSLMAVMGLFGCGGDTSLIPVVCTPNPSNVNVYRTTLQPWVNDIFQFSTTPIAPSSNDIPIVPSNVDVTTALSGINPPPMLPSDFQIQIARSAAFKCLINETERWSDTQTIKFDDSINVQITVTFISPALLQTVFLNEVLRKTPAISGFEDQMQTMLNSVAARDELLFLFTITMLNNGSTDLSSHTIDIPIKDMLLTNGAWLEVKPKHADQILDQPINLSNGPVFGYVAYPLAVLMNNTCNWVLDPKYNTSLVITILSDKMDDVENNIPHSWVIPYSPLMHVETPGKTFQTCMSASFDPNLLSPAPLPPNGNIEQTGNWQDFARFVWSQVTHGNY